MGKGEMYEKTEKSSWQTQVRMLGIQISIQYFFYSQYRLCACGVIIQMSLKTIQYFLIHNIFVSSLWVITPIF